MSNVAGSWFEVAVRSSAELYRTLGMGLIVQIPVSYRTGRGGRAIIHRQPSPVDFIGTYDGIPVAFDCKVTAVPRLPHKNVHEHQIKFLRDQATFGTGVGALLVCFEEGPGVPSGATFLADVLWYLQTRDLDPGAASVPLGVFMDAAADQYQNVARVVHGGAAVPVHFGPAILALADVRKRLLTTNEKP